jgi:site-specific DNA-methyltransferase (adenine-specific)
MAQRKRKNPYIAGVAAMDFKPGHDWEIPEAREMFTRASHVIPVDHVKYEDCVEGMKSLPDGCVDLVIADPPFGIDFDGHGSQYNRDGALVVNGYQEVHDDYDTFTTTWISELPRIMKDTASAFIFSGWTNLKDVLVAIDKAGFTTINHLVWKYQFGVFTRNKFVTSHYHVLFLAKNPAKYFFNKIEHYPLDVWDIPRTYRPGEKKNGTKLPATVVGRCIDFCTKPGDLVFDPFMGNGTTAACAKARYRHFLGFELNDAARAIIETNVLDTTAGQDYLPYKTFLPGNTELAKKYPAVRRKLASSGLNEKPASE